MFPTLTSSSKWIFVICSVIMCNNWEVFFAECFTNYNNNLNIIKPPQRDRNQHKQFAYNHNSYEIVIDDKLHKCLFEVPSITLNQRNYPYYRFIGSSNKTYFSRIETCCSEYRMVRYDDGCMVCVPKCKNCLNGFCVAPTKCECYDGFVKNDNGDCVFVCPVDCLNGKCYLDSTCKCNPGYTLDETRKYCRPICTRECKSRANQNCTEPETCGCQKGYTLQENGCEPICDPPCGVGGECIGPNKCECKSGYILKSGVCQEKCYQNCLNGVCEMRNRCICNIGYRYHEQSMSCIPVNN